MNTAQQEHEEEKKITLGDFKSLCTSLFQQQVKIKELEEKLQPEKDLFESLKAKILAYLEEHEMEKFHIEGHGLVFTKDRFTVPTPKTIDQKKALGKFLQAKGIFWELFSVNSQTLNSFYNEEMAAAVARGDMDFKLPGINEPSHVRTLALKKS